MSSHCVYAQKTKQKRKLALDALKGYEMYFKVQNNNQ